MSLPLLIVYLGACESTGDTGSVKTSPFDAPPPGELVTSELARNTAPSTANVATLAAEDNQFAWQLTTWLWANDPASNRAVSPWSLEVAFAQAYAGADPGAKAALEALFNWDVPEPDLHEAFDATWLAVDGHTDADAEQPVTIQTTSQVFADDRVSIEPDWLDTVGQWYGTGAALLDLDGDPAGSTDAINGWVSDRTAGLIPSLVTEEVVAESALILVNAVYFAASWNVPFTVAGADQSFTLRDGTTVSVPTLDGQELQTMAHEGDGYVLFDLAFTDPDLVMTLLVPDEGRFDEVITDLDWPMIQAALDDESTPAQVVSLPKFSIDDTPDVLTAIEALGGEDVFGGYTRIAADLELVGVDHHAVVTADEDGVVAAAATALEFDDSAMVPPDLQVTVDRPFVWMLRDETSGTVLFSGMLLDPR